VANVIRAAKAKRIRWARSMQWEMKNAQVTLLEQPQAQRPLTRDRHIQLKLILKKQDVEVLIELNWLRIGPVAVWCEQSNKLFGSIKNIIS
jgi:hypothetical protein